MQAAGSAAAAVGLLPHTLSAQADEAAAKAPETLVKLLFDSLTAEQRKQVCFAWDHVDPSLGLLRTRIAANWHVTKPVIESEFFTSAQQKLLRDIFAGLVQPDWMERLDRQLKDDEGGYGKQSVAIFGTPGTPQFEFVMTGRHITVRCDGNSSPHLAFGGPIFYGHAASGFREKPGHPGNIFWPQAVAANSVFHALDAKQQAQALLPLAPEESAVGFRRPQEPLPGVAIADLSADQKKHVQTVLQKLLEPYRQNDRDRAIACLKSQGGLDHCRLAFYEKPRQSDERVWDIWRLEGPAFVWHYRGSPHVHTWVHIADDPTIKLNA